MITNLLVEFKIKLYYLFFSFSFLFFINLSNIDVLIRTFSFSNTYYSSSAVNDIFSISILAFHFTFILWLPFLSLWLNFTLIKGLYIYESLLFFNFSIKLVVLIIFSLFNSKILSNLVIEFIPSSHDSTILLPSLIEWVYLLINLNYFLIFLIPCLFFISRIESISFYQIRKIISLSSLIIPSFIPSALSWFIIPFIIILLELLYAIKIMKKLLLKIVFG